GGETAEMPGVYSPGDYDVVGFVIGYIDPSMRRDPVRAGDLLIGLPSSGLHTNGFSLARKVFEDVPLDHVFPELGRPLGEVLLEPHRSYLNDLRMLPWKAAAHITGGGLLGNIGRALPEGLAAELERSAWSVPPVFELIARRGRVADDEMLATFNMGLGMVLVTDGPLPGLPVVGRVLEQAGSQRVSSRRPRLSGGGFWPAARDPTSETPSSATTRSAPWPPTGPAAAPPSSHARAAWRSASSHSAASSRARHATWRCGTGCAGV